MEMITAAALALWLSVPSQATAQESKASPREAGPSVCTVSYGTSTYAGGCGCSFQKKGDDAQNQFVFLSDVNFANGPDHAWICIDAGIIRLEKIRPSTAGKARGKRPRVYRAAQVSATVKTSLSKPAREGDEGTSEEGAIEIVKDGKKVIVPVKGGCGC